MALMVNFSSIFPRSKTPPFLIIRAQSPNPPDQSDDDTSSPSPSQNPSSLGFGPSKPNKKAGTDRRRRSPVIRREPVLAAKPSFGDNNGGRVKGLDGGSENAFLLAWLGLGAVIIVEGIALAASGFLPEEWDGYFVNYLYPSFTPTVFLFVAGTVVYGVTKYLQNEKPNGSK